MKCKFIIHGEPQGKGRPRFSRQGSYVKTYTPEETVIYENLVVTEFKQQCRGICFPEGAPLDMRVTAYYSIPKSASKKKRAAMLAREIRPTKKPDSDNILKVIADSLNKVAYNDDAQIADTMIRKFYSDVPRVEVMIQTIKELTAKGENRNDTKEI